MARLHTDGFEFPNANPFDGGYSGSVSWSTSLKRSGAYAINIAASSSNWGIILLPGALTEFYFRAALAHKTDSTRYNYIILRDQSNNPLVSVHIQGGAATGGIRFWAKTTKIGEIDYPVVSETFYLIEVYGKIGDGATGHVTARVDGEVIVDMTVDIEYGSSYLYGLYCRPTTYSPFVMDDLALNDITGTEHDAWCGSGHIVALSANGQGVENWQRNSGSYNYEQVDEVAHDSDTTYVYTTGNDIVDDYPLETVAIPAENVCLLVQPVVVARKVDIEAGGIEVGIKSDDTTDYDSPVALTTSYVLYRGKTYTEDPDTSAAWTQSGIDNLKAVIRSDIS